MIAINMIVALLVHASNQVYVACLLHQGIHAYLVMSPVGISNNGERIWTLHPGNRGHGNDLAQTHATPSAGTGSSLKSTVKRREVMGNLPGTVTLEGIAVGQSQSR